jgi:hypothetical protein
MSTSARRVIDKRRRRQQRAIRRNPVYALDCLIRRTPHSVGRERLKSTFNHIKRRNRPLAARYIGRQAQVQDGAYQQPQPIWMLEFIERKAKGSMPP